MARPGCSPRADGRDQAVRLWAKMEKRGGLICDEGDLNPRRTVESMLFFLRYGRELAELATGVDRRSCNRRGSALYELTKGASGPMRRRPRSKPDAR